MCSGLIWSGLICYHFENNLLTFQVNAPVVIRAKCSDVYPQYSMALNSRVCFDFFHFHTDYPDYDCIELSP